MMLTTERTKKVKFSYVTSLVFYTFYFGTTEVRDPLHTLVSVLFMFNTVSKLVKKVKIAPCWCSPVVLHIKYVVYVLKYSSMQYLHFRGETADFKNTVNFSGEAN